MKTEFKTKNEIISHHYHRIVCNLPLKNSEYNPREDFRKEWGWLEKTIKENYVSLEEHEAIVNKERKKLMGVINEISNMYISKQENISLKALQKWCKGNKIDRSDKKWETVFIKDLLAWAKKEARK